jgi:hypothetical protein
MYGRKWKKVEKFNEAHHFCKWSGSFENEGTWFFKKLMKTNYSITKLYSFPKIHKEGAQTERLSKWIDGEMSKLHSPKGYSVENSYEFVEKIENVKIDDESLCHSM